MADINWAAPWEVGFKGVVVDRWWTSEKRLENDRAAMTEVRKKMGT